ncbi:MAG: hypothetical protein KC619_17465 [Myxococcales bacterium]|nr:hypothetical protein [Myxococcales bacterium]
MRRRRPIAGRELAAAYLTAKRTVLDAGFEAEVAWQEYACHAPLSEARFLSEAAWVVLNAGMREAVVRQLFPQIAAAFDGFVNATAAAAAARNGGREIALGVFGHPGKIDAIVSIVDHVAEHGLDEVLGRLATDGVEALQCFPYLGPATSLHLAKNLGYDVAKPDRHLTRIAQACGYSDPQVLCRDVFEFLGEPVPVVDLVFWRFATLSHNYVGELLRVVSASSPRQRPGAPATPPAKTGPAVH